MKKTLLCLLTFFFAISLFAQEPTVKFYLNDGSTKQYKLEDIDIINVLDKKNNYVLRIHYQETSVAYYPAEIIGSIKFEKDSLGKEVLNVYIFTYPKSYLLFSIDSLIFFIDKYQPLTIGTQVWMLKNLDVYHYRNGDGIPEVTDATEWANLTTGAWCYYDNNSANGTIYSKLYNWYAVNDTRGLAPTGWHVPSDDEWTTLTNYLGGQSVAGGKMKETGTSHWQSPNKGATNSSGFSALPGGYRDYGGTCGDVGYRGYWWSSPEDYASVAWGRYLLYDYANFYRDSYNKASGFSVRCVRDN